MRKYIILFFSALAVFCSCGDNTPDGILDEKRMADVLVDVHIANGTMFMIPSIPDSLYKYGLGKYLLVFKKHGTDSAQFTRSYKYYTRDVEKLVAIYDVVNKGLQKKSDSLNKIYLKQQQQPQKIKPENPKPVQVTGPAKPRPNKLVKDTVKRIKRNVIPK
ncbi:DUF4296 domain-containing protein [Mucilaginibacter sp. UR6-1]|uniref:DUF4296 domain-containing protein n=1 Tax=Mucilaginibacter sp. UR6-1 TaxID=1435643 RepID=UPI001E5B3680|nr:DUF4296 domain-containing protein [Mucilaginibacter sp. UR6-1]MCC8408135.1 DUF4296 domain-containing protein [Mucilaginibacter sp. UR6-1]